MAKLRVEPFEDMGDPAILLNTDQDGIRIFEAAVRRAHEAGDATFEHDGITHRVVREGGAADIELGPRCVTWRFDNEALVELLNLIQPLIDASRPCHQYVDLNGRVDLLVLSVDEYKRPLSYGVFSQLYPAQTQTTQ